MNNRHAHGNYNTSLRSSVVTIKLEDFVATVIKPNPQS